MYIGLDIGATKIKGVSWSRGKVYRCFEIPTPHNFKRFKYALLLFIRALSGEHKIKGVGLGIAGQLDIKKLKITNSPNLKFLNDFNIGQFLKKEIKIPIKIDNDARCFLRAEYKYGAGKGYKNLVGLTLGSGVGGAIITNNKLLYGVNFSAGEVGHSFIDFPKTIEDMTSKKFFKSHSKFSAIKLARKAKRGDKKSKEIFREFGRHLGLSIADLINILNPGIVIIGGGISADHEFFLPESIKTAKKYIVNPKAKNTKILPNELEGMAGAIGAALLFKK
jgi:glucokinase